MFSFPDINVSVIAGSKFRPCHLSLMDSFTECGVINSETGYFDFLCNAAKSVRFVGLRTRQSFAAPIHIFEIQVYGSLSANQATSLPWETNCGMFTSKITRHVYQSYAICMSLTHVLLCRLCKDMLSEVDCVLPKMGWVLIAQDLSFSSSILQNWGIGVFAPVLPCLQSVSWRFRNLTHVRFLCQRSWETGV